MLVFESRGFEVNLQLTHHTLIILLCMMTRKQVFFFLRQNFKLPPFASRGGVANGLVFALLKPSILIMMMMQSSAMMMKSSVLAAGSNIYRLGGSQCEALCRLFVVYFTVQISTRLSKTPLLIVVTATNDGRFILQDWLQRLSCFVQQYGYFGYMPF